MRTTIKNRPSAGAGRLLMLACAASLCALVTRAQMVTTCAAGKYLKLDEDNYPLRQGLCITCPAGTYCPSETPVILNPRQCNEGYFSGYGEDSCTECPAGWKCTAPNTIPVPCGAGEYSTKGSTSCLACPDGTVCRNGLLVACVAGQVCKTSDDYPEPIKCPAGKYCDGKSSSNCPTGHYSAEGSATCTPCPKGSRCPSKDHEPIACGGGTYQDQPGQTTCQACPATMICPKQDEPPQSCPAGSYGIYGGATCFPCPAGVSCSQAGNGVLSYTACAIGDYSESGMADCARCPAGKKCDDQLSVGADCGTGEYSLPGEIHCTPCPPGHYCPNKDREPIKCVAGFYADAKKTTCTQCPAGHMCAKPDEMPRQCPDGQTAVAGSTYCDGCPTGMSCKDGGTPTECAEGKIPNQHGDTCVDCPAGMACPAKQWAKMVKCGPGFYSTDGMEYCAASPAGKYAPTTIEAPKDCAEGWYSDIAWTSCLQCPPGFQCKGVKASEGKDGRHMALCKPGSYYDGTKGECKNCPANKMCPIAIGGYRAEADALACPDGMYAPEGSFDCEICRPGKDCKTAAAGTDAANCAVSDYSLGGWKECKTCPKNYECPNGETIARCPIFFYSEAGEQFCKPCPDGGDCQDIAPPPCANNACLTPAQADDPVGCKAGYYAIAHDMTCKPCPKGHECKLPTLSATLLGPTTPTKCPGGKYADEGQAACTDCPDEYYSKEGSEYCSPIPPGYKYKADKSDIEVCPHKTYSYWGIATCETCPDGYLCPQQSGNGYLWQNSCPKGSWCKAGVETKCAAGKFGTQERGAAVTVCETCPPGYNCLEGTADFEKVPCPKGGYCEAGKTVVACPAGTFNDELYGKSVADCKTCPIGHSCGSEDAGGTVCGEGYYCPRGIASPGLKCPAGTHGNSQTGKRDINECLPCPPGHYCPEGSGSPTASPAGFYTPLSGMPSLASLYKCPATYYCPDTAMTTPKGHFCDAGYVCPAGSKSKTEVECPEGTYSDRRDLLDPRHCNLCPKGYSCKTHSTTAGIGSRMIICPNNRYCPEGTKNAAVPICPAGTYAPFTGAKSQYDCLPCPAGKYCENLDDTGPKDCEKGHYCPPGTQFADQFPCGVGYYNDVKSGKSKNACLHCGFGKYCGDTGLIAPVVCPKGTYNSESTTAGYCTVCDAGYMCAANRVYAEPCTKGFYSERGWWYCKPCPVGTYCPNEATTDTQMRDQLCPEGTFCERTHSYTDQEPNVPVTKTNEKVGIDIWPNTLQSGTPNQYACPQFKYCPEGTNKPLDIPRGTMQHLHAAGALVDAIQMVRGSYSKSTSSDPPYVTTACEKGYYCPFGSFEPIPCPAGTYRDNVLGYDATSCGKCPAGTYCPAAGTHTPTVCPTGSFCPEGAKDHQPCPRGTYNDVTGLYDSRGCKNCQAGHYCPFLGQTSTDTTLHKCDAGFYCIGGSQRPEPTDEVTGSRCPVGFYCTKGAAAAQACVDGQYAPFEGGRSSGDCILCKPGYYCLGSGGGAATNQCKAGIYCLEGAVKDVTPQAGVTFIVPAGSYTPQGSFFPILCQEGHYNGDPSRGDCDKCEAGYFCDRLGTTKGIGVTDRQECAKGHYCPKYEWFEAEANANTTHVDYRQIPCEAGKYNDQTARTGPEHCLDCKAKKACEFRGVTGDSEMVDCAPGYFCKSGAATRYPEDTTNTQNGPCPPGHYCPAATENPTPCPAGKFNKQYRAWDASFCLDCPPGYVCDGTGNTDATQKIEAGKFGSSDGQTSGVTGCGQSATGLYCPLASHFELICPMGFYQTNSDRGQCFECPAGSFCMNGVDQKCKEGYYCP